MYQDHEKTTAMAQAGQMKQCIDTGYDRTVEENINIKIAGLKAEIERLEASKKDLEPLMKMRIRDIRDAMNY
jgi:hypothetical protein